MGGVLTTPLTPSSVRHYEQSFKITYREEGDEGHETSSDRSPPDVLAAEIMIADNREDVHDNEQQQNRRRHPLGHRLEESHHENLQASDVVQNAEHADDSQRPYNAQALDRVGDRHFDQRQYDRHQQHGEVEPVPQLAPVADRICVYLHRETTVGLLQRLLRLPRSRYA